MKKLLFIFLAIISICNLNSQNTEPLTHLFSIRNENSTYDTIAPSPNYSLFQQNQVLRGWHWGGGESMTSNIGGNQWHGLNPYRDGNNWYDVDTNIFSDGVDLILLVPVITDKHDNFYSPLFSTGFKYEPTLRITNPGSYNVRDNEIFGFGSIRGYISSNPLDTNYSRLVLTTDSLINTTVLKDPWICNEFYYKQYVSAEKDDRKWFPWFYYDNTHTNPVVNQNIDSIMGRDYNGLEMYFTINFLSFQRSALECSPNALRSSV